MREPVVPVPSARIASIAASMQDGAKVRPK